MKTMVTIKNAEEMSSLVSYWEQREIDQFSYPTLVIMLSGVCIGFPSLKEIREMKEFSLEEYRKKHSSIRDFIEQIFWETDGSDLSFKEVGVEIRETFESEFEKFCDEQFPDDLEIAREQRKLITEGFYEKI